MLEKKIYLIWCYERYLVFLCMDAIYIISRGYLVFKTTACQRIEKTAVRKMCFIRWNYNERKVKRNLPKLLFVIFAYHRVLAFAALIFISQFLQNQIIERND